MPPRAIVSFPAIDAALAAETRAYALEVLPRFDSFLAALEAEDMAAARMVLTHGDWLKRHESLKRMRSGRAK